MLDWIVSALRPHWFRGKGRLLNAIAPAQGTRQASVFGAQMTLDLGEAIQRNVYLGTFEPSETRFARQWLKPGMTFVDVGANIGYFTALAASRVGPTGRVLALEPSPRAFGTLGFTRQP